MREVSLNDLEVEIVREIKKWRDKLLNDEVIHVDEIDAGDAATLASDIVTNLGHGINIVPDRYENGKPVWESHRRSLVLFRR